MKFKKVTARFDAPDIHIAEELICDIFFGFNLKGVVCDIPLEEPDEGFGTKTLPAPEFNSITGFMPMIDTTDLHIEKINSEMLNLKRLDIDVQILTEIVDEKDWADAWKDYFEVTKITDRLIIKPDWKEYQKKSGEHVIHLDPGMAFGTGTHPTTAMCLELIDQYLVPGNTFLDVGCGSGILMIAAAKLGSQHLRGIDTDPVAITIARQNLVKNKIMDAVFDLECTTLDTTPETTYDFIAANIIAQVIVDIMPDIKKRMHPKTTTLLSGIIRERLDDIMEALNENQLKIIKKMGEEEWVALLIQNTH